MKIAFFPSGCLPFHAKTLKERPLGGMETAIIRLAEALSGLGHRVFIITGVENPPLSSPLYLPIRALQDLGPIDILLAVREWKPIFLQLEAKLRFLWTGDSYDQPQNIGIGDRRIVEKLDCLLPVSEWHKARLCEESGFPETKAHVLRNGIHLPLFAGVEDRHPKRLIYSSTPYRGLTLFTKIFPEIKRRHPEAELHAFSGYKVYSGPNGYNEQALAEYQILVKNLQTMGGCIVHDNISQDELAREFLKSAVLAYPNTFEETSCITAMEAQAAGCAIVTSNYGALSETVGDAGILIEGQPGSPDYITAFIDALDRVLSDESLRQKLAQRGRERAKLFDWSHVAQDFTEFCARRYGLV